MPSNHQPLQELKIVFLIVMMVHNLIFLTNHDDDGGAHSDNDDGDAVDSDDDDDGAQNILTNQVEIGQGSSNPLDGPRRCRHSHNNCGLRAGDCDGDPMALK